MQVSLFKKVGTYKDKKDGKEKQYTNFYLRCGDSLIPIEPCFFPDKDNDNRDYQYAGRKEVLKAFADTLPDKAIKEKPEEKGEHKPQLQPIPDDGSDTPF